MKSFEDVKKRLMKNKEFADAYRRNKPLADFIDEMLSLRAKKGWTQKDLADRLGMKVPNISRIEAGKQNITFSTMQKISEALNGKLLITLRKEDFVELSPAAKKIMKKIVKVEKKSPAEILEKALKVYESDKSLTH